MNKVLVLSSVLLFLLGLVGCANTRDPKPCLMKNQTDNEMLCEEILAEYEANTASATSKISKNKSDDGRDFIIGLLVWPGLADFKNADGIEGNALLDRNIYLKELAQIKRCDLNHFSGQPKKYTKISPKKHDSLANLCTD